ncbi:lysophospholipid acyltransferase family protein [Rubrobacter indicoceani]|uniref:lysophospholipid acyltransferase family protein n=1 Tax=Rubrobacter indicoceani TaxID=2051957 RepID=UPI000E5B05EE|nr:lysophospholipid acyltransferase family protein [Rubrobacter indicoceani]
MPRLDESGMSRRYALVRAAVILAGRVLLGFEVRGEDRVPRSGPVVVASNHWRFFDPVFVCMAVPRRVQWMAKKELFLKPLVGLFGLLGAFPVDRQGGGRGALRAALRYLEDGWALGIFPEGTRRRKAERHRSQSAGEDSGAKNGAIMLAARSGAPVLPVFIGEIPSPLERLRGKKFSARIGEPIYPDNTTRGRAAYGEASGLMMKRIYEPDDDGGGGS